MAGALVSAPLPAAAATIDSGSITVDATVALTLGCAVECSGAALSGSSAGTISGMDGSNNDVPYTVSWDGVNNLSGSLSYTTDCMGEPVLLGGDIAAPSSYVVNGATLVYGGVSHSAATVTAHIQGPWDANVATITTSLITIRWSTLTITVSPLGSAGATTMQPLPPVQTCAYPLSQTFAMTGDIFESI